MDIDITGFNSMQTQKMSLPRRCGLFLKCCFVRSCQKQPPNVFLSNMSTKKNRPNPLWWQHAGWVLVHVPGTLSLDRGNQTSSSCPLEHRGEAKDGRVPLLLHVLALNLFSNKMFHHLPACLVCMPPILALQCTVLFRHHRIASVAARFEARLSLPLFLIYIDTVSETVHQHTR